MYYLFFVILPTRSYTTKVQGALFMSHWSLLLSVKLNNWHTADFYLYCLLSKNCKHAAMRISQRTPKYPALSIYYILFILCLFIVTSLHL